MVGNEADVAVDSTRRIAEKIRGGGRGRLTALPGERQGLKRQKSSLDPETVC